MCLKSHERYLIIGFIVAIIIFLVFYPLNPPTTPYNETMYTSFLGLPLHDGSIFIALLTGLGTILVTLYSTNRSYKAMKLSLLPDNATNLLIDLEFAFNEYKDPFVLLTVILKYWKDNQKVFKLLTPKFYKEFLKIISKYAFDNNQENNTQNKNNDNNQENNTQNKNNDKKQEDYSNSNSDYILYALIAQITNIAFDNDECNFSFIKPELIKDKYDIEKFGENLNSYKTIKINTEELNNYIDSIEGITTKKLTRNEFKNISDEFEKLLETLKNEIKEYD